MNKFYRFEVYCSMSSGDLEYVVKYFDLPIIGSGTTIEEAIEEAQGNLEVYLEYCEEKGISVPNPSLPESMDEYSGKITLRVSKSLHKRVAIQAKREGVSINSLLNEGITTYITTKESANMICRETAKELSRLTTEKAFEMFSNTYRLANNICEYETSMPNNKTMKYIS